MVVSGFVESTNSLNESRKKSAPQIGRRPFRAHPIYGVPIGLEIQINCDC